MLACRYGTIHVVRMAKSKPKLTLRDFASMGGKARAKSLSKRKRREIAKKAAMKRWYGGHDIGAI